MIALDATLAEIVLRWPEAATTFERLGLDYCCGGHRTLDEACDRQGLDARTVALLLNSLRDAPARPGLEAHDVRRASIPELCDHIVSRHHDPLRKALVRIGELLDTVVRVHGRQHPELIDLQRLFAATRADLEHHLGVEEEVLFPACRELDADPHAAVLEPDVLALLEDDHAATGDALAVMRELTDGFRGDTALCGTHGALLHALRGFELDLHRHVHEENNVLFPRVRARLVPA
jgi:regulator of cell morphogenesis and NO signaling